MMRTKKEQGKHRSIRIKEKGWQNYQMQAYIDKRRSSIDERQATYESLIPLEFWLDQRNFLGELCKIREELLNKEKRHC